MAQFTQFGRPIQIAITSPSLTVTDIMSMECNFDPELHEHFGGGGAAGRFPRMTIGNDNTRIKFKTTDYAALGLVKGMELTTVACTFEPTVTAITSAGAVTQGSGTIGMSISCMRVVSAFQISNEDNGQPGEIEVELRAAIVESTGAAPTITLDASFS